MRKNMNWIKDASLLFIVFLICYSLLIIGDFLLSRVISSNFIIAEQIENQRMIEEDEPIKEELVNNGFESTYYPDMFDLSPQLVERMEKMKIAPIGGKPLTKTYLCNEGFGMAKYYSDRFGLRNLDKKWEMPIDTIFIGDSFIHGACVNDNETIVSIYEELTGENSINLGFGSNNPQHYSSLSYLFIPKVKPSKVILAFYANDNMKASSKIYELYVRNNIELFIEDKKFSRKKFIITYLMKILKI